MLMAFFFIKLVVVSFRLDLRIPKKLILSVFASVMVALVEGSILEALHSISVISLPCPFLNLSGGFFYSKNPSPTLLMANLI